MSGAEIVFPPELALSVTGRIGTRFARLEHLHQWLEFEEEEIFPMAEKRALVDAVAPLMGPTTLLVDAVNAYQATRTGAPK